MEEVCQRRRTSDAEAQSIKAPSASSSVIPDELYEGYVFDLDGTIYLGDELLPGARRLVLKLRELGKRVVFLSNNPTKDPEMFAQKLTNLGIQTPASDIVNTVVSMTRWLSQNHPDAAIFPIAEEPLRSMLHFYFIFWASPPYVPFVPIGGLETELFFDDEVSNEALIELRRFIVGFIEKFEPETPQIWQWERNIEL